MYTEYLTTQQPCHRDVKLGPVVSCQDQLVCDSGAILSRSPGRRKGKFQSFPFSHLSHLLPFIPPASLPLHLHLPCLPCTPCAFPPALPPSSILTQPPHPHLKCGSHAKLPCNDHCNIHSSSSSPSIHPSSVSPLLLPADLLAPFPITHHSHTPYTHPLHTTRCSLPSRFANLTNTTPSR